LNPAYSSQVGSLVLGGGVEVANITRLIDTLLEEEILRQNSILEQASQELSTLRTVESAFGEFSGGNSLSAAMDKFFNALQDLSAHPGEIIWQKQVVSTAEALAGQFRTMRDFLGKLENQITLEVKNTVEQINTLASQIGDLNNRIQTMEIGGGKANNLRDQRDQYITELSKLIDIQTVSREYGVVDVFAGGLPLVIDTTVIGLETGLDGNGDLGVAIAGRDNYSPNVEGGRLGGLLSLKNELVGDIREDIDNLAGAMIQKVNQYHVQGVGSEGSFTELTGWRMMSENLADFEPPVNDGSIYIRLIYTDPDTGEQTITRSPRIDVDASTDTLATIAEKINAIDGLSASVVSSKLHIQADTDYNFDFLPAVLSEPTDSNLTGTTPPDISISGIYTGIINQTFTCRVIGSGDVGNGTLQLEVRNGDDEVVTTLNIGSGYAAGDNLDIGDGIKVSLGTGDLNDGDSFEIDVDDEVVTTLNIGSGYAAGDNLNMSDGIKVSLGTGDLNDGDSFEIDVFADTDTSEVLSAAGINPFFSGNSASNMAVCSDITSTPGRIATALGANMTDNTNILRMAGLRDEDISSLEDMTAGEFYHQLVTNVGQNISIKQMRQDNSEVIVQNLTNQRDELSGIDINEEAARLLAIEQMFQAMAKFMTAVQSSILAIMDIM
jgi:flagellar hook-associated protein 1 FlgK